MINQIIEYIETRIESFTHKSSEDGFSVTTPAFEISCFDYLLKAKDLINSSNFENNDMFTFNEIVHYSKTAIECQIDTLLNSYTVDYKKFNLPRKLEFIENLNLISKVNLIELNKIRNKTIHEYEIAKLSKKEILFFYDLTQSVLWSIQPILTITHQNRGIRFNSSDGYLYAFINEFQPIITFTVKKDNLYTHFEGELSKINFKEYTQFIRLHLLLSQYNSFRNKSTFVKLMKNPN